MDQFENRKHFRLKRYMDVAWRVSNHREGGEGIILNISQSGALLQTDHVFVPQDDTVVALEASPGTELPFGGKQAKIVWFRRISAPQPRCQCGLEFITNRYDKELNEWLEEEVTRISQASNVNILNNYLA